MHARRQDTAFPPARAFASTLPWLVALVALLLLARSTDGGARDAWAAPATGIPNPADDRLRMVAELQQVNRTLELIRQRLERGGIGVEVTKMPTTRPNP